MFYCLDELITMYHLESPFLDVGCGIGDLSDHVAAKGWKGKAIDFSGMAIASASDRLKRFPGVIVEKSSLAAVRGSYRTVFLWDVLEHIEDDEAALLKVSSLLSANAHLVVSVPSNPSEWRWDDIFYGHHRRYTAANIRAKLTKAGLEVVVLWDLTYPFFWVMRRIYTKLKRASEIDNVDKEIPTKLSCKANAWDVPFLTGFLDNPVILWWPLSKLQFMFRHSTSLGHEMLVLARKTYKGLGKQSS